MTEQERVDQQEFDEAVKRKGKYVLEALAGVGVVAALIMSMVALIQSGEKHEATRVVAAQPAAAKTTVAVPPQTISTKIVGAAKPGPDGKKHDMFTTTEFNVKAGQPVKITVDNTDDAPHSISAPTAGVNIVAQPGVHTYTMVVKSAGKFQWYCLLPCDSDAAGWAMKHPGYMSGYITAA